jgi:hypothetical protein
MLETTELADDETLETVLDAAAMDCEASCCACWIAWLADCEACRDA